LLVIAAAVALVSACGDAPVNSANQSLGGSAPVAGEGSTGAPGPGSGSGSALAPGFGDAALNVGSSTGAIQPGTTATGTGGHTATGVVSCGANDLTCICLAYFEIAQQCPQLIDDEDAQELLALNPTTVCNDQEVLGELAEACSEVDCANLISALSCFSEACDYEQCVGFVQEPEPDRPNEEFFCGNGETVPQDWVCDGEPDCDNGADESFCTEPVPGGG